MTLYKIDRSRRGSGFYESGLAGELLPGKKLVYLDSTGAWKLADANSAAKMPALGITMERINEGQSGSILTKGHIGSASWNWGVGVLLYASETAGNLTATAPTDPANLIQIMAVAKSKNLIWFSPRQIIGSIGPTYTKTAPISADELGKPAANNPEVVDLNNVTLYSFTVDTDFLTFKFPVPTDYASGGLKFQVVWTNDGGTDDQNKNIRVQFDYQVSSEGEIISGSHGNSPKNVNDAYTSATGWIDCRTDYVTIEDGDFSADDCIFLKVSFVTAPATVLTCNPHLVGICIQYTAYAGSHP
jgi:hypothetical protein